MCHVYLCADNDFGISSFDPCPSQCMLRCGISSCAMLCTCVSVVKLKCVRACTANANWCTNCIARINAFDDAAMISLLPILNYSYFVFYQYYKLHKYSILGLDDLPVL